MERVQLGFKCTGSGKQDPCSRPSSLPPPPPTSYMQQLKIVKTTTHHPNQDTNVVRDIFSVANKSRKPPDLSPSSGGLGASKGCWGISLPLNRAISARIFSALSTLPFTRSHPGDSGMSLPYYK